MTTAKDEPLTRRAGNPLERPLWAQVKSSLIHMIHDDNMGEHARLPSEQELCARFGVSRTVVREALNQLVVERRIYKLQGKGAFVAAQREEQNFLSTTSIGFSGDLLERNKTVTRHILQQRIVRPSERARKLLRLTDIDEVVELSRVLIVENVPRMVVHSFFPASVVPGLEQIPFENRSLYDTLRKQYGIILGYADRWIEATLPSVEEARLLQVADDTPMLSIESLACSKAGDPIEYYHGVYCTNQARLHLRVESR